MKKTTKNEIVNAIAQHGTVTEAAKALNISRSELFLRRRELGLATGKRKNNKSDSNQSNAKEFLQDYADKKQEKTLSFEQKADIHTFTKLSRVEQENKLLKAQFQAALKEIEVKQEHINNILEFKANNLYHSDASKAFFSTNDIKKDGTDPSIINVMLSDWHFGEVVSERHMNGVNRYNLAIAQERIAILTRNIIDIAQNHTRVRNKKIVLHFMGDFGSGGIHPELAMTDEVGPLQSAVIVAQTLIKLIEALLSAGFKEIVVTMVSGNHDRLTSHVYSKNRVETSATMLTYYAVIECFRNHPCVKFTLDFSTDQAEASVGGHSFIKLYNTTLMITHGDEYKGGGGLIGIMPPITRGVYKHKDFYSKSGIHIDTVLLGHFHQHFATPDIRINGSPKGSDEWTLKMGFKPCIPSQQLFLVHPVYGPTTTFEVFCDEQLDKQSVFKDDKDAWLWLPQKF